MNAKWSTAGKCEVAGVTVGSLGCLSARIGVSHGPRIERRQQSPVTLLRRTLRDRRSALTAEGRSRCFT
jgi:hypothetical protein